MVTGRQVKILMTPINQGKTLKTGVAKNGV
jgi:hypothetical protein